MLATLTPTVAADRCWDCVVLGAGPAGALAAREVARRGASVLLVDRAAFPRYKVCGCCLNPRALGVLDQVGLGQLVGQLGAVALNRFRLGAGRASAIVPLPTGAAVSRSAFDVALIREAVAAGVEFLPDSSATVSARVGDEREISLRHPSGSISVRARVVLVAPGLGGKTDDGSEPSWETGSRIGAGAVVADGANDYAPHIIHMACGRAGYVGLVRIEDGQLDVAAALDPSAVKAAGGPGLLAAEILDGARFPAIPGLGGAPWKGTPHLTRTAPTLGGERLFRLGDAAGYVEPFTGEGMAWALAGARAVAPLAVAAVRRWDANLLREWEAEYRRQVTRRQLVCRLTAGLLRRPGLTRAVVRLLSVLPAAARPALHFMYRK
jgi:menaquinone-9 beta-reductase